jgi:serine protease Do
VWRGIKVVDIAPELAKRYSIENTAGVLIADVEPDSTSADAGLARGDIIREINKKATPNKAEYNKVVAGLKGDALVRTDKGYVIINEEKK